MQQIKRTILLVSIALFIGGISLTNVHAMKRKYDSEEKKTDKKICVPESKTSWDSLPAEVKQHILSYIADDNTLRQEKNLVAVFNGLYSSKLPCTEFANLIIDEMFLLEPLLAVT